MKGNHFLDTNLVLQIWNVVSDGIFVINYYNYSYGDDVRCIDWDGYNRFILWYTIEYFNSLKTK